MQLLRHRLPALVLAGTLGLYLLCLLPKLVWEDATGLWVGQIHLWSDYPLHLSMARQFADNPPAHWFDHHPMVGGEPLRYPFFAALISGMLLRLGASVPVAFLLPMGVGFALLLVCLLPFWVRFMQSSWLALLPIILFFLSAGPGFLQWFLDIGQSANRWDALLYPPKEYGATPGYEWYAGNFLVGMLLPQRAFLPGMTLTVAILWVLARLADDTSAHPRRLLLLCGVGAGVLPIVHFHSLIALVFLGGGILVCWAGREKGRWWDITLYTVLPLAVLAGTLYLLFLRPVTPYPNFVSLRVGYQASSLAGWLAMWVRFWWFALPVGVLGTFLLRGWQRGMALGAIVLFLLGNVVQFQPIAWDNSKIFLYVYFGLTGAMAAFLRYLWGKRVPGRVGVILLTLSLTLTGFAELLRLQQPERQPFQILSPSQRRFAQVIRAKTPPTALFLTAMDTGNAIITGAGRPVLLGFGGWMPNFGIDHRERERDLKRIYAGESDADEAIERWKIRYIFVSDSERNYWGANETALRARYPVLHEADGMVVFESLVQ